jgi:hypothetical protein
MCIAACPTSTNLVEQYVQMQREEAIIRGSMTGNKRQI